MLADLGQSKAQDPPKRSRHYSVHVEVEVFEEALNAENALAIIKRLIVADGTE